jgi:regulator of sirC expression with transglutaminase-like and TPR domain
LAQGLELLKQRKKRKAVKVLEEAVAANAQGWEALQELAMYHMEAGRMSRALKLARQAEGANPSAPYAQLVIGAALQEKGKKREARAAYQFFLKQCPTCRYADEIKSVLGSM